jgi:hypothetical protein
MCYKTSSLLLNFQGEVLPEEVFKKKVWKKMSGYYLYQT